MDEREDIKDEKRMKNIDEGFKRMKKNENGWKRMKRMHNTRNPKYFQPFNILYGHKV